MTRSFDKSMDMFKRASKVIPQGLYGHFNPGTSIPGHFPYFVKEAKGSHFTDVDGNDYIDFCCAYGPMILGYANKKVDEAFAKQAKKGTATCPSSEIIVDLAEKMVDTVEAADWAMFAKNGGDTTSWAIYIARAYRRRNTIVLADGGYHGTQPWAGSNHAGLTPDDRAYIKNVPFGDLQAFERLVAEYPDEIAGVMLTPYNHPTFFASKAAPEGYWKGMRRICDAHDIVLIIDDVRAGWRLDVQGSAHHFGFKPDLTCFCKALANGYPISSIVGTEKMKLTAAKVFHTGSYWNNSPEMAAALACIDEMISIDAAGICKARGDQLRNGLENLASGHGLQFKVSGPSAIPFIDFTNETNFKRSQLFCKEMSHRGVYFLWHHNMFISAAHTEDDINKTLAAADEAFKVVKKEFGC